MAGANREMCSDSVPPMLIAEEACFCRGEIDLGQPAALPCFSSSAGKERDVACVRIEHFGTMSHSCHSPGGKISL